MSRSIALERRVEAPAAVSAQPCEGARIGSVRFSERRRRRFCKRSLRRRDGRD